MAFSPEIIALLNRIKENKARETPKWYEKVLPQVFGTLAQSFAGEREQRIRDENQQLRDIETQRRLEHLKQYIIDQKLRQEKFKANYPTYEQAYSKYGLLRPDYNVPTEEQIGVEKASRIPITALMQLIRGQQKPEIIKKKGEIKGKLLKAKEKSKKEAEKQKQKQKAKINQQKIVKDIITKLNRKKKTLRDRRIKIKTLYNAGKLTDKGFQLENKAIGDAFKEITQQSLIRLQKEAPLFYEAYKLAINPKLKTSAPISPEKDTLGIFK